LAGTIEPDTPAQESKLDIRHRSYVMGAVLESVAFVEAFINELLQDAADNHPSYVNAMPVSWREAWALLWSETRDGNAPLLLKFQLALIAAGAAPFDRGAPPYQSSELPPGQVGRDPLVGCKGRIEQWVAICIHI
jgi:hypothetical protein